MSITELDHANFNITDGIGEILKETNQLNFSAKQYNRTPLLHESLKSLEQWLLFCSSMVPYASLTALSSPPCNSATEPIRAYPSGDAILGKGDPQH